MPGLGRPKNKITPIEKELAARQLCRRRLLPFVYRNVKDYDAGWIHQEICEKLEEFEAKILRRESPRLMLFMPPRHGKSELASTQFPAWFLGRHPEKEVISCSYASGLAMSFSRKVRELLRNPRYQSVFPNTKLGKDSQSTEHWETTESGGYLAAGVGGPITGHGADCVSASLTVSTPFGNIPISKIKVGDKVLGYDHQTKQPVWTKVRAISTQRKEHLIEIGPIECTPDHRVWTENRGYIQARELESTDDLVAMSSLQQDVYSYDERTYELSTQARSATKRTTNFLFSKMCTWWYQLIRKNNLQVWKSEIGTCYNLHDLLPETETIQLCSIKLPYLRQGVYQAKRRIRQSNQATWSGRKFLLLSRMLQQVTSRTRSGNDEITRDSSLFKLWSRRIWPQTSKILQPQVLYRASTQWGKTIFNLEIFRWVFKTEAAIPNSGYGLPIMRNNRCTRSTPYRSQCKKPCTRQFDNIVQDLPYYVSQQIGISAECFSNSLSGDGEQVVDLQTDTENFFCEGVLVHNCLIIDDPVKNRADAESPTERNRVWDWYSSTAYTRLMPGGGVLLILTRWHTDDLAGRLLYEMQHGGEEWEIVVYPAVAVRDEKFRAEGEALHPSRYDLKALQRIKKATTNRDWGALYQQQPSTEEGAILKRSQWNRWTKKEPPECEYVIQSYDTAYSKNETADFSVITTWGLFYPDGNYSQHELADGFESECMFNGDEAHMILLDCVKGRYSFPELKDKAYQLYAYWKPDSTIIEARATGLPLAHEMRRSGIPVQTYTPSRGNDKMTRVHSVSDVFASGYMWAPKTEWADDLIEECHSFPSGKFDDQVDSTVQAVIRFRQGGFIKLITDDDVEFTPRARRTYY